MSHRRNLIAAVTIASLLAGGGAALAAGTSIPTQLTVTPLAALQAGDTSPGDVPGIRALRAHKTIPAGYVMLGQKVDIKQGTKTAGASLLFSCSAKMRLRGFLTTGSAGFQSNGHYFNQRMALISSFPGHQSHDTTGAVYAVCR